MLLSVELSAAEEFSMTEELAEEELAELSEVLFSISAELAFTEEFSSTELSVEILLSVELSVEILLSVELSVEILLSVAEELSLIEALTELSVERLLSLEEEPFPMFKLHAASVASARVETNAHSNVVVFLIFFIINSFNR